MGFIFPLDSYKKEIQNRRERDYELRNNALQRDLEKLHLSGGTYEEALALKAKYEKEHETFAIALQKEVQSRINKDFKKSADRYVANYRAEFVESEILEKSEQSSQETKNPLSLEDERARELSTDWNNEMEPVSDNLTYRRGKLPSIKELPKTKENTVVEIYPSADGKTATLYYSDGREETKQPMSKRINYRWSTQTIQEALKSGGDVMSVTPSADGKTATLRYFGGYQAINQPLDKMIYYQGHVKTVKEVLEIIEADEKVHVVEVIPIDFNTSKIMLSDGTFTVRKSEAVVNKENYTILKKWEDAAKEGGLKNIVWSVTYNTANGVYVFVRAMVGAQDKTLAGRGMNRTEKANASLDGLTTIATFVMPLGAAIPKGIKGSTFQTYSKQTKGRFKDMGSRHKGFKTDKGNQIMIDNYQDFQKIIDYTLPELSKEIDKLSDAIINDTIK